ncbi:MAG: lysophospholipid acyltransferase family protein [Planctomycetota bacterium]
MTGPDPAPAAATPETVATAPSSEGDAGFPSDSAVSPAAMGSDAAATPTTGAVKRVRRRRRLPRPIQVVVEWLQFTVAAFLLLASFLVPRRVIRWLGAALFGLLYRLDRRHRVVVKQNLVAAFGDATPKSEIERMARDTYRFFGMNLFEILWLWRQSDETMLKHFHWHRLDRVHEAAAQGHGVIFGTSHYGFWEVQTFAMRPYCDRLSAVMRPLDNAFVNRLLVHMRQCSSAILFEKKGALLGVMRALRQGYYAGLLIDQDGGKQGIAVPFFGQPVMMMDAVGQIAYKTRAPIVMCMPVRNREKLDRVEILCSPVISADISLGREAGARKMIEECNRFMEEVIRQYPEEYFWLHRRWKHGSPQVYERPVE